MSLIDRILKTPGTDWTFEPLDGERVPGGLGHEPIRQDSTYVSIFLRSMRIIDVRRGWTKFYPVVHSYVSIPHRDGDMAEFQVVTSPPKLRELDAKHVDRVITLNHRLLGPVPYRGGDLKLEIGLFSVKSADLAKPFLEVLEVMATAAGVSFASIAKPFVAPLKKGLELLTGAADLTLEIGLSTSLSKPETGYFFVMRAKSGSVRSSDLRVGNDYRLVDQANEPVARYPYLVFSVEASEKRDDWFLIPEISSAHAALRKAVRTGRRAETEEVFAVFKRTVLTSPDLLLCDAQRLVKMVGDELSAVMPAAMISAATAEIRNLKSIKLFAER